MADSPPVTICSELKEIIDAADLGRKVDPERAYLFPSDLEDAYRLQVVVSIAPDREFLFDRISKLKFETVAPIQVAMWQVVDPENVSQVNALATFAWEVAKLLPLNQQLTNGCLIDFAFDPFYALQDLNEACEFRSLLRANYKVFL